MNSELGQGYLLEERRVFPYNGRFLIVSVTRYTAHETEVALSVYPPDAHTGARAQDERDSHHDQRYPPTGLDKDPVQDGLGDEDEVDLDEGHGGSRHLSPVVGLQQAPRQEDVGRGRADDRDGVDGEERRPVRFQVPRPRLADAPRDQKPHRLPNDGDVDGEEQPHND